MDLPGYKIGTLLGDGGMASVYKGEQLSLQRPVAIKVLKHNLLDHEEIRKRFERESIIIARLNHPNIIHVIDQGLMSDGRPFFVMEYVKSIGLQVAMKHSAMTQNRALDIFTQIAKALAYAHKNNVVHCDIKPENILVDFEGNVRVLDFGIAQIFEDMGNDSPQGEDFVMGSENYMAPEQHRSVAAASERSDIYSLGVIMYLYFTHQLPRRHEPESAPAVSELNRQVAPALNALIMQCLEPDPSRRPQTADALRSCLLHILQGGHLNDTQHQRASAGLQKSFRLLDVIEENKHGAVYLFEEQGRAAAFIIKKKPLDSPGLDVAQRLRQVSHPNLLQLYGCSKNTRAFIIVMEYCAGGSLAERLVKPCDPPSFYSLASQILNGLIAARRAGITHGNLRPTNILFGDHNIVKVADFGLDEHYRQSQNNWYASDNREPDEDSDVFALGVIFYQMLTAELPVWKNQGLVKNRRFSNLSQDLQAIIRSMLVRDRSLPALTQVAKQLDALFSENETLVQTVLTDNNTPPTVHRKRRVWCAGIAAAVLVVASLMLLLSGGFF